MALARKSICNALVFTCSVFFNTLRRAMTLVISPVNKGFCLPELKCSTRLLADLISLNLKSNFFGWPCVLKISKGSRAKSNLKTFPVPDYRDISLFLTLVLNLFFFYNYLCFARLQSFLPFLAVLENNNFTL